jgi:hypothetical protein
MPTRARRDTDQAYVKAEGGPSGQRDLADAVVPAQSVLARIAGALP